MASKRLTLTIDKDIYDAVDRFARAQGRTKSEVFNDIMKASVTSLNAITDLYYRAQTMSKKELDELKASISTVGDFAETSKVKLDSTVLNFTRPTPI